jgi:hypothetical protein
MIVQGDCRLVLAEIEDDTFDSSVTDPPYEIGILGHAWDSTGVAFDPVLWSEMFRVLKPGAYLTVFSSPRTYHRVACAVEDAGFMVRDMITWLKGGASMPKGGYVSPAIDKALGAERKVIGSRTLSGTAALSLKEKGGTYSVGISSHGRKVEVPITESASDLAKRWEGWAYNLKPVIEPILLAQKPFKGAAVRNVMERGVGALNVRGCAIPVEGCPGVTRWPPNAIITHADDCRKGACVPWCPAAEIARQSGETRSAGNKKPTSGTGAFFGSTRGRHAFSVETVAKGDSGAADRYFPRFHWHGRCAKKEKTLRGRVECPVATVKPWALIRYLMKLTTPRGGRSLDPFAGSGQAQIAAYMLGSRHYGIELKPEHFDCATERSRIMKLAIDRKRAKGGALLL